MPRISPSIASCDQTRIGEEINRIGNQYEDLHIDIEDGNFTPNITFGLKTINAIRSITDLPFSVHLMVTNPELYIEQLAKMKCNYIFVHVESSMYLRKYLNHIRQYGIKAGIALNPVSDINDYLYMEDNYDAVLYLTSEIDGLGERFQKSVIEKMKSIDGKEIWVDGGVDSHTIKLLPGYVNTVVMGRAVFTHQE